MTLAPELARILPVVLATLLGGALGWWLLAPWAERNLTHGRKVPARAGGAAAVAVRGPDHATFHERAVAAAPGTRTTALRRTSAKTRRLVAAVAAGMSWGLVVWCIGLEPVLPAVLAFAAAGTVLAIVDLVEQRLPDRVTGPAAGAVALSLVTASAVLDEWVALAWAALGGATMFAAYLVVAVVSPAAMGMGDVKLAGLIGLLLGWFGLDAWLLGLLGAFVIGGVAAITALLLRRVTLRGAIPFGPSMLAGALGALAIG